MVIAESFTILEEPNMLTALLWIGIASVLFSGFFAFMVVSASSRMSRVHEWEEPIRAEAKYRVRLTKTV